VLLCYITQLYVTQEPQICIVINLLFTALSSRSAGQQHCTDVQKYYIKSTI